LHALKQERVGRARMRLWCVMDDVIGGWRSMCCSEGAAVLLGGCGCCHVAVECGDRAMAPVASRQTALSGWPCHALGHGAAPHPRDAADRWGRRRSPTVWAASAHGDRAPVDALAQV